MCVRARVSVSALRTCALSASGNSTRSVYSIILLLSHTRRAIAAVHRCLQRKRRFFFPFLFDFNTYFYFVVLVTVGSFVRFACFVCVRFAAHTCVFVCVHVCALCVRGCFITAGNGRDDVAVVVVVSRCPRRRFIGRVEAAVARSEKISVTP